MFDFTEFESDSESDSFAVDASTLPSSSNYDVNISDHDDTPRHRKLPRHNPSGREAPGFVPGLMLMADAVGVDVDVEGVDTVTVAMTQTEDRP